MGAVAEYEDAVAKRFAYRLKRFYGITPEQYDKLLEAQDGVCAGCGRPPTGRRLDVDHDHVTGEIRGLLCHRDNRLLGMVQPPNGVNRQLWMYDRLRKLARYALGPHTGLCVPKKRRKK